MNTWSLDAVILEPHERGNDGKNWARLILKRKAEGGQLPRISLEFAREALGLPPEQLRQPGEDSDVHP